jgi:hypothetical protein
MEGMVKKQGQRCSVSAVEHRLNWFLSTDKRSFAQVAGNLTADPDTSRGREG